MIPDRGVNHGYVDPLAPMPDYDALYGNGDRPAAANRRVDFDPTETETRELAAAYQDGRAHSSRNANEPDDHTREPDRAPDPFEASLLDSDQIAALPPPKWLIHDYLVQDSLALLYGPSGTSKTFLAIDWALHIASGSQWNRSATSRGGVLYVIAEGAAGVGRRLAAWSSHHRVYNLAGHDPIMWRPQAVNLTELPEVLALCAYVKRQRPALVVFDTLARCTVGAEENSARDMGHVVANLDRVRRASGACVLVVHHAGKDGSAGARGSSALKAAMDTELEMTATDHRLTLRNTKQKEAAEAPPLRLDRLSVGESCVLVPTSHVQASVEIGSGELATLNALQAIQKPGGVSDSEWREVATQSCSRSTYYNHRARLIERKMVQNVGSDARPRYVVTDPDQPAGPEA